MPLNSSHEKFKVLTYLPLISDPGSAELSPFVEEEVVNLYGEYGFKSTYQSCWMLPLWTAGGGIRELELFDKQARFAWTPVIEHMPSTREFVERFIFPIVRGSYRVVALITPPQHSIPIHVDCNFEDLDKLTHKLRYSISGNISSLWFLNRHLKKVSISPASRFYLIDGSHPHGVDPSPSGYKITLCVGSPWSGDLTGSFLELMVESEARHREHVLWRDDIGRPLLREIFIDRLREAESQGAPDPRISLSSLLTHSKVAQK